MTEQNQIDYYRIARAIEYIIQNFKNQPDLEEIASEINVSPSHFQRMFTEWAGVSPKKFLQFVSIGYAKNLLKEKSPSLFDTALETGLSGNGRLHDLFINIEGMTPGEYKNGGENLTICYSFNETLFGKIIIASTQKGICHLAFADDDEIALQTLNNTFPKADLINKSVLPHNNTLKIFNADWNNLEQTKLHLKGTEFQLKVWEALLKIPMGQLTSYGNLAKKIGNPNASRAVGSAIGDNPVAFLIPCHRVIQSSGIIGQYHWGSIRKTAIIGWEAAKVNH
jgi:AraC family transcriptional regulator, regulatory protein of adaptative response / methylated-DNA-[protein]-cysteine methyltransferase